MVAKIAGIPRDTRRTHPFGAYRHYAVEPVVLSTGDVFARAMLRRKEVQQSIGIIRDLLKAYPVSLSYTSPLKEGDLKLVPNSFAFTVTEGWRGGVCHAAVTGQNGELIHYKIKDPSMHNWKALELSLRNLEISDFPINNKSYDLSYAGHDL